ncbi:Uncharacterised protein [Helicobacter pametensis]|nr:MULTISPECIES: hypothetical protein [unclassified Eikenella]VDH00011.1 Uncharacterised protein [Helicobacter pametensis]
MRNQGIYNGCTALMLVYATLFASQPKEFAAVLLLNCITVTACGAPPTKAFCSSKAGCLFWL